MTLDEQILLFCNSHHSDFFDLLMTAYTSTWIWVPFYMACFGALVYKYGWVKAFYFLLFVSMAVGAADFICASVIRPAFQQLRPSNPDNPFSQYITVVNGYRGGRYGMPSCHAANCFALAASLIVFTRSRWLTVIMPLWALFICYTRMYLGVHYPSDLLVGGLIGTTLGTAFAYAGCSIGRHIQAYRKAKGFRYLSVSMRNPLGQSAISITFGPITLLFMVMLFTFMTGAVLSI